MDSRSIFLGIDVFCIDELIVKVVGKQNASFFKCLSNGGYPTRLPLIAKRVLLGPLLWAQGAEVRLQRWIAITSIDFSPRENIHTAGKDGCIGALEHQNFKLGGTGSGDDDRRGGSNWLLRH